MYGSVSQLGGEAASSSRKSSSSIRGDQETLKLFNMVKSFILQMDKENDYVTKEEASMKPCLIDVYTVAVVMNSIIGTRGGASTAKEELKMFVDIVIEDDPKFKELLQNEGTHVI